MFFLFLFSSSYSSFCLLEDRAKPQRQIGIDDQQTLTEASGSHLQLQQVSPHSTSKLISEAEEEEERKKKLQKRFGFLHFFFALVLLIWYCALFRRQLRNARTEVALLRIDRESHQSCTNRFGNRDRYRADLSVQVKDNVKSLTKNTKKRKGEREKEERKEEKQEKRRRKKEEKEDRKEEKQKTEKEEGKRRTKREKKRERIFYFLTDWKYGVTNRRICSLHLVKSPCEA